MNIYRLSTQDNICYAPFTMSGADLLLFII